MSLAPKVEVKDGKVYQDGKPVEETGEFYLVRKGTFEEIVNRIRERNTSPEEREYGIGEDIGAVLPPWIEVDNDKFRYYLDKTIGVLKGKFLWIRYQTIERELDEFLEQGVLEQGGQNE